MIQLPSRIIKNHQESSSIIKSNTRSISYRAIRPYVAEDELTGRQMPRSNQLLGAAGSNVRPAFWRYHEKMSEEPQASRLEALVLAARLCFLRRSAFYILFYIYIYMVPPPQDRPFCCLDFFDTYPTCNGVAMPLQVGWIQDSRFLRTLSSKSWIQDSRFKIPRDSFEQILNPNLESNPWIQDSRFLGTLSSKSWIQDSRFKIPRDSLQEILNPGFKMDSRFAPKSSWNLESWILGLDSRFAPESSWESWILKFRPEK